LINLRKNKYGFYELVNNPTPQYLQKFYSKKYYQNNKGNYKKNYNTSDKVNLFQKYELILDSIKNKGKKSFFRLGMGRNITCVFKKNRELRGTIFNNE
jgi:hypothetical protein